MLTIAITTLFYKPLFSLHWMKFIVFAFIRYNVLTSVIQRTWELFDLTSWFQRKNFQTSLNPNVLFLQSRSFQVALYQIHSAQTPKNNFSWEMKDKTTYTNMNNVQSHGTIILALYGNMFNVQCSCSKFTIYEHFALARMETKGGNSS